MTEHDKLILINIRDRANDLLSAYTFNSFKVLDRNLISIAPHHEMDLRFLAAAVAKFKMEEET